jgi:hypothetical protein
VTTCAATRLRCARRRSRSRGSSGLRFNDHLDEGDGPLVFAHACKMGLEGIVSKRRDSRYRSGRSSDWIKSKNPNAPAANPGLQAWGFAAWGFAAMGVS